MKGIALFDLLTYVKLKKEGYNLIQNKIIEKNISLTQISKEIGLSRPAIFNFINKKRKIRSDNLLKIVRFLGINKNGFNQYVEGISKNPYGDSLYKFSFPIVASPLHIRIVGYIIGDGCLETKGCRWYQKSEVGSKLFVKLIKKLCNNSIERKPKMAHTIPTILLDIACTSLNISRKELKTYKAVKKIMKLPREYKLQLLAAIIVDEGSVYKSYIKIVNTDKKMMRELRKLIISLDYPCSEIRKIGKSVGKKIIIKGNSAKVNFNLNSIHIYSDGMLKIENDLERMSEKYGEISGLWQKQKLLEKFSKIVNLEKTKKGRMSRNFLIPLILREIRENPIKVKEFAVENHIEYNRAYKLFYRLENKNKIKKIGIGTFSSNEYKGPYIKSLNHKIRKLLFGNKNISIKEVSQETGGNPKSIATYLSKLHTKKYLTQIKRGTYTIDDSYLPLRL